MHREFLCSNERMFLARLSELGGWLANKYFVAAKASSCSMITDDDNDIDVSTFDYCGD